jgi:peptidoglycan/LPS O-acetylase OafA/YrhL
MSGNYRIAGKVVESVVISGGIGLVLFVAFLFLASFLMPASGHPDVVDGRVTALFLIIGISLAIFSSGVIAILLTFNDLKSLKEALAVSFFSGLVATIAPLLIGAVLGTHNAGIFYLCLVVVVFCIMLSIAGGLVTFLILSCLKKRRIKR